MSAVRIVTRTTRKGEKRYLVYYRRGGQGFPEEYAGSFKFEWEAKKRRDIVAGELAVGRDPRLFLEQLRLPPTPKATLARSWDTWATSKRKVGESAQKLYGNSKTWWVQVFGPDANPETITVPAVTLGLDDMLAELAPSTVRLYLSHLAMMLDFTLPDGTPNPARSKKIELPSAKSAVKQPPTNDEWATIAKKIPVRSLLAVRLMECCALRVSEACGVEAGDLDVSGGMILVRRAVTKTEAGRRWVPVPAELLDALLARGGVGVASAQVYYDLQRACEKGRVRPFGTHAFRHRRISLWLRQGVDDVQVARWAGHAKPSESTDTYGHTVVDALADEWLGFWQTAYGGRSKETTKEDSYGLG